MLALWWLITLDESPFQWVPTRTPTVHWCRYDGRPWVTHNDGALRRDKRRVFRQCYNHAERRTQRQHDLSNDHEESLRRLIQKRNTQNKIANIFSTFQKHDFDQNQAQVTSSQRKGKTKMATTRSTDRILRMCSSNSTRIFARQRRRSTNTNTRTSTNNTQTQ